MWLSVLSGSQVGVVDTALLFLLLFLQSELKKTLLTEQNAVLETSFVFPHTVPDTSLVVSHALSRAATTCTWTKHEQILSPFSEILSKSKKGSWQKAAMA